MATKAEIVEALARERRVEQMVRNITHKEWCADLSDLSQMVYLILLEYDAAKVIDLWENGQINYFLARIIINQFRSSSSPFHTQYRKFMEHSEDIAGKDWIDE